VTLSVNLILQIPHNKEPRRKRRRIEPKENLLHLQKSCPIRLLNPTSPKNSSDFTLKKFRQFGHSDLLPLRIILL